LKSFHSIKKHCIVIVFGTRPEAIKLIPLIKLFKNNKNFLCITINTGQHRKMIKQILEPLNMSDSIDIELNIMKNNQSLPELTSKIMLELNKIYLLVNPKAVIVQGDTTSSFAASLSAFYQKIPIFHVEAGLRTSNFYSPFPEEFNRVAIDDISTLYFASTELAADNLLRENKNQSNIFVTGNTVVDILKITLEKTSPSEYIQLLLKVSESRCKPKEKCKNILLTCHRRENYYKPIVNILNAIKKLLEHFDDIVIILPFHLNPNVRQSIKIGLPKNIYNQMVDGKIITDSNYLFYNRLLLIKPLNYFDLIHLQKSCYFIMTDSGGIQEESISIGKPVLILRENTERPEGILAGSAILTGTSSNNIYYYASLLLKNKTLYDRMAKPHNVYGSGNSSKIIVNLIEDYFENKLKNTFNFSKILNKLNIFQYNNISLLNNENDYLFDLVIVLTVWKRNNVNSQLMQIKRQTILRKRKTNIIIFQNFYHINIDKIIEEWKKPGTFYDKVTITFIKSPIETGYFGRFIAPLLSPVNNNAYFIICDDDLIWGDRYFDNMIRVVNEGFLATRNGRLVNKRYEEVIPNYSVFKKNNQVCFNEDIEYDFGGHIWAGRMSWLREAWKHIPISLDNCEDFWLSATLKTFYNISTKTPKCPCPKDNPINPDLCASSDRTATSHINSIVGKKRVTHFIRSKIIKSISNHLKFRPMLFFDSKALDKINKKLIFGNKTHPLFNLSDILWKNALYWQ
jgi:UDP-N-acetylglucosamine 2-epimerase (non-hydrolysing)